MPLSAIPLPEAFTSLGEALLIGLLIGAQRESHSDEPQPGVRDFILISLTGGVCGVLGQAWLTASALISIALLLAVFHYQTKERTGITTEMAAVAAFALGCLTATPGLKWGAPLSIGATIVVVAFLEAKAWLHKLVREIITEREFNDTLSFLAVVLVIYPVLPEGQFGPYGFIEPRKIWLFVILVSSISYVGYFLEKFLGTAKSLKFTSIMGGLASTTAATAAFAHNVADEPSKSVLYSRATVIANAIQFPRVLALLYVVNPALAAASFVPLALMTAAGLAAGLLIGRTATQEPATGTLRIGNPFRLWPALKFGAIFTAILFATKAAAAELGAGAVYWTSAIGGSLDADSVAVSVADLVSGGKAPITVAFAAVMIALVMNAVLKTGIAFFTGGARFGWRVAAGFAIMFGAGLAAVLVAGAV
ncbi:MAG: DUF4010 domain-containing protein [Acidobacteriales bacterium]|nr:DUF4010 domain-containing protein [Terriglobales bacterium]